MKGCLNYGFGEQAFNVDCRAEQGFTITYREKPDNNFQVVNTTGKVFVYLHAGREKMNFEFGFNECGSSIYIFKNAFHSWLQALKDEERGLI